VTDTLGVMPVEVVTMHDREWVTQALRRIEADFVRSADTHLVPMDVPSMARVRLYFKDESSHPTGSLKHRLARSLFLYALCNGWLGPSTTVIEASSGSTAVSEAYFAKLLGLEFVAVMPRATSAQKIAQIEFYGGRCHFVDRAADMHPEAERLARECGGHFMDQFTYAERVTDWRGNNNIAESIFEQMAREPHPEPAWVVCPAGTGGTSATIGRFVRYRGLDTRLCVVDPDGSVFLDYWRTGDRTLTSEHAPMVEGIGRPRVEPSFQREVVDRMLRVPDAASFAGVRFLERVLGRLCGPSTGTNVWGAFQLLAEMHAAGEAGSVVTLICDGGSRYLDTCFSNSWLADHGYDIEPYLGVLDEVFKTGRWSPSKD
jgi:cysteine synthase A